ncbi:MAG TPA: DUF6314 family protein [Ilumatobacter sp.]|nr:DUF6314 family protein [Ilumatobacter sp.]
MSSEPSGDVCGTLPPTALVGDWTLARTIHERRIGTRVSAVGTLSIHASAPELLVWDERGELQLGTTLLPISRRYLIARADSRWNVLFEDGREFHPWAPGAEVVHACGADLYRGRYQVDAPESGWTTRWECLGPSKDYVVETALQRPGPAHRAGLAERADCQVTRRAARRHAWRA